MVEQTKRCQQQNASAERCAFNTMREEEKTGSRARRNGNVAEGKSIAKRARERMGEKRRETSEEALKNYVNRQQQQRQPNKLALTPEQTLVTP